MKLLQNNCRCGRVSVHPVDWNKGGKKLMQLDWYIKFRFYDDDRKKTKQVILRGFNLLEKIEDRREAVKTRLKEIEEDLEVNGWNPITGKTVKPILNPENKEINKWAPFIDALRYGAKQMKVSADTMKKETLFVIGQLETAAEELGYTKIGIWEISLKHLYTCCERASYKGSVFSGNKFNRNKKVLTQVYRKLVMLEVAAFNYPLSLERARGEAKKKTLPIDKPVRKKIDDYLRSNNIRMWLFVRIFFHSGARATEMLRVKVKDVDLRRQTVTYLVLKGDHEEYKDRPILDIALPFWKQAIEDGDIEDYVFGSEMSLSPLPYKKSALKTRWQRMCKAIGINIGMYRLKHTHTTGVSGKLGTKAAAEMNAESEEMIKEHYDLDFEEREQNELKAVNVPFV